MTLSTTVWGVVLVVGLVPAVRVALKPAVWREIREQPWIAGVVALLLVALGVIIARLDALYTGWLPVAAIVALLASGVVWWRARPDRGLSRGLAPGSLGIGASLDALADPRFYAKQATVHGPVFKTAQFHRPVVVITSLPLGLEVLERERDSLRSPSLPFWRQSPVEYVAFLRDTTHPRHRDVLVSALAADVVRESHGSVVETVRAHLEGIVSMAVAGAASADTLVSNAAFASMLQVIFGVSVGDPRIAELRARFDALGVRRWYDQRRPEERPAFAPLLRLAREVAAEARDRAARGAGFPPSLVGEILSRDPGHVDDDILLGDLLLFFHVTRNNVVGVMRWALQELLAHPACVTALRAAEESGADRLDALADDVVSEVLRLHQSEFVYREVTREITVKGFRIPRRWLVRVGVREGHDDPAVFPDPHNFDPQRFAQREYQRTEYCPTSDGTHSAFGADLARSVSRALVKVLAVEFDSRASAGGPPERDGNRHWSHWRPSRALRVDLSRRRQA